jgi:hypothetical protein
LAGSLQNKLMNKSFYLSGLVCIILTSCNGQRNITTAFPSLTQEPSSTLAPTFTLTSPSTRIPRTEPASTATFTPFPSYPHKKVLFEYYILGQHSYFDIFYSNYRDDLPNIVLYEDGQMVVGREQKILSADEILEFLSKLDTLGFFSIESNQQYDPTDKLYNFGDNYQEVNDGLKYCILVNTERSKNLCAQEDYMHFLIPEMKSIIKYFDEYEPAALTPYFPDRILLSTRPADANSDDLSATAIPWDNRFPSLDFPPPRTYEYDTPPSIRYIEGDMAKEIYTFMTNSHSRGLFIQDGKKYIVDIDVVLPHEMVINAYQ